MDHQQHHHHTITTRPSLKRKLEQRFEQEGEDSNDTYQVPELEIRSLLNIIGSTFSSAESDRFAARHAIFRLWKLAKNEELLDFIVECGAVPLLVRHLQAPPPFRVGHSCGPIPYEHEVESVCALALKRFSMKPEHQQLIVNAGALSHLVDLLKRHKNGYNSLALNCVLRRAADALANLAYANGGVKIHVRIEGGIPPLVELLEFADVNVQIAAVGALRTLAFKNDENKNQIVKCNALPILILMLRSEYDAIHYEAVSVIGDLVRLSPNLKRKVLKAGALQPLIGLLSSSYPESQREAALLLGQFAADSSSKVHIVQRGAVPPLIEMLKSPDSRLKEMSAFALGRLSQDTHNQAGIAHSGGTLPLLKLLDSRNEFLQLNAVYALYGLADNEDSVADLIKVGGVQKLQDGEFFAQPTKECVANILKRLEEKIHGRVLNHLLYLMRVADKVIQRRVALALSHLCAPEDQKTIFIDNNGLELLLGLLESTNLKQQRDSSAALYKLAIKATSLCPVDAAPSSPTPQVYFGEQYVNNPMLSDVTFLVDGKRFYAHRICLLDSSEAFRAMFVGGYREKDAEDVEIPNIRWDVFELMMRFIYTGSVDIHIDIAQDLLRAADQYLLEGLKHLCEYAIAQDISVENVLLMYELSEDFNAVTLRHACILFIIQQFHKLSTKPWYSHLIQRILPEIWNYFMIALTKPWSS